MTNQLIQDPNKKLGICYNCDVLKECKRDKNPKYCLQHDAVPVKLTLMPKVQNEGSLFTNFPKGKKIYDKLQSEYLNLTSTLDGKKTDLPIDLNKIKESSSELYQHGMHILNQVYEINKHSDPEDVAELKFDKETLETEVQKYSPKSTMYKTINERIEKISSMLSIIKNQNDRIDEMLCQVELCIDCLKELSFKLPELLNRTPETDIESTKDYIYNSIDFADRVNAEWRKLHV